jgi:hypothetical protein
LYFIITSHVVVVSCDIYNGEGRQKFAGRYQYFYVVFVKKRPTARLFKESSVIIYGEDNVNMKRLIPVVMVFLLVGLAACAAPGTGTTTSSTPSTTSTPPVREPIEVVSVTGPMPPINPGGPTVEIVLKNISTRGVVALAATLGVSGAPPGGDFTFDFDVMPDSPLAPGNSATARMTLIGGGFDTGALYPLTVSGALAEGETFEFTSQVRISPPPGT